MSEHLPECDTQHGGVQCICDELVRAYLRGLNAAREAVAEAPIAIREPAVLLLNRDVALAAIDALREVDTPQQQRTEHINLEQ